MQRRFQIEDLLVQDGTGVIFRALDTQENRPVALRRFFPFGASGGGLHHDEKTAYQIAAGRLARLQHPSLRAVVAGGCDPVDGIPFLVTEWVDGKTLAAVMRDGPLAPEAAAVLLGAALEVSELLSQVLAEEAVWVDTAPENIVVGSPESDRRFTFWISPIKWLGDNDPTRGLASIVMLAEEALDWKNRVVGEQSGHGLGAWFNWLRASTTTATLRETREKLAAAIGAEPPLPIKRLLASATLPPAGMRRRSKIVLGAALTLSVAACAAGGWLLMRPPPAVSQTAASALRSESEQASQMAAELDAQAAASREILAKERAAAEANNGIIDASSRELLGTINKQQACVEGVVRAVRASNSGKTHYLHFAPADDSMGTRASISDKHFPDGLPPLIGKKVRLTGKVKSSGTSAPEIKLAGPDAIEVLD